MAKLRLSSASQMICPGCRKVVAISKHEFCRPCREVAAKKKEQRERVRLDKRLVSSKKKTKKVEKSQRELLVEKLLRKIK